MKIELVFNFPYSKLCVKSVVDLMHGINVDSIDLVTLVEIMKFLNYEKKGKASIIKKIWNARGETDSSQDTVGHKTTGVPHLQLVR